MVSSWDSLLTGQALKLLDQISGSVSGPAGSGQRAWVRLLSCWSKLKSFANFQQMDMRQGSSVTGITPIDKGLRSKEDETARMGRYEMNCTVSVSPWN